MSFSRQRVELYTHFNDEVDPKVRTAFRELVLKRAGGSPVAYLVGRKEFFSLTFMVSPDVLIPRPESEFVVAEYLAMTRQVESPRSLDVGTGSGCLAIASARRQPAAQRRGDRHLRASPVCGENECRNPRRRRSYRLSSRRWPRALRRERLLRRDPRQPSLHRDGELDRLEPGVKDFEPRPAPGRRGDWSRDGAQLIEEAPSYLKPGGHLISGDRLEPGSHRCAP